MLMTNQGLLYNLSENKIRGPRKLSYTEDSACDVSFIDATILERQKDVLKDVLKYQKFHEIENSSRKYPVCHF